MRRIFSGIFFFLLAGVIFLGLYYPTFLNDFWGITNKKNATNKFSYQALNRISTAGPTSNRVSNINITYPEIMLENETQPVDVKYDVKSVSFNIGPNPDGSLDTGPSSHTMKQLDFPLELTLASSGFAIKPEETILVEPDSILPLEKVWTITPISEGTRLLILHIHENIHDVFPLFPRSIDPIPWDLKVTLNESSITPNPSGIYKLPITVRNYWGVSQRIASLFLVLCTAIGTILFLLPISEWIKKKFKMA